MSIDRLATPQPGSAFRHEAFLYGRHDEFVAGTVSFVREGLANGESVLVLLTADKVEMLQTELHRDRDRVFFGLIEDVASNPARLIPRLRDFVDEHGGGDKGLRGLGEPIGPRCRGPLLTELQRHESLVNLAFASVPALWLLCTYDVSALPRDVVDEARRSHAFVLEQGLHHHSSSFQGVDVIDRHVLRRPLAEPPSRALTMDFDIERLRSLRAFVALHAVEEGLDLDRTADLVLAVNELGANSVVHASGHGRLRVWRDDDMLVCQVDDDGHIADPLVGLEVPSSYDDASRGLWVVNQLCDLVQISSSPVTGTSVRVYMTLGPVSLT